MALLDNIKKYWFLYGVLSGAVIWIATINSKTFDSPEQKVEVVNFVEHAPSPEQQQRKLILDSVNTAHAITERAKRTEMLRKSDSIKNVRDSLTLDRIERLAVQMQLMKDEVKEIKDNHN